MPWLLPVIEHRHLVMHTHGAGAQLASSLIAMPRTVEQV